MYIRYFVAKEKAFQEFHNVIVHLFDGVELITFKNQTHIDSMTYENSESRICEYIKTRNFNNLEVIKYIESEE